ncbi:hypothetical protein F5Y06DRAFT_725 [Hypoxylon sp. FL0890]|nr:hypothetical protein F5Y06DRAFT_725 [Hypoxylon sp. FL0890]
MVAIIAKILSPAIGQGTQFAAPHEIGQFHGVKPTRLKVVGNVCVSRSTTFTVPHMQFGRNANGKSTNETRGHLSATHAPHDVVVHHCFSMRGDLDGWLIVVHTGAVICALPLAVCKVSSQNIVTQAAVRSAAAILNLRDNLHGELHTRLKHLYIGSWQGIRFAECDTEVRQRTLPSRRYSMRSLELSFVPPSILLNQRPPFEVLGYLSGSPTPHPCRRSRWPRPSPQFYNCYVLELRIMVKAKVRWWPYTLDAVTQFIIRSYQPISPLTQISREIV